MRTGTGPRLLQEGSGDERPGKGDEVSVHYTGRLLDGTVFDSSVERNELFKFALGENKVGLPWIVALLVAMKVVSPCALPR